MFEKAKSVGGSQLNVALMGGLVTMLSLVLISVEYTFFLGLMTAADALVSTANISFYGIIATFAAQGPGLVYLVWLFVTILTMSAGGAIAGYSAYSAAKEGDQIKTLLMAGLNLMLGLILIGVEQGFFPSIIASAETIRLFVHITNYPLVASLNLQGPGLIYLVWMFSILVSLFSGVAAAGYVGYTKIKAATA